jgi:hypothetical protein
MPYSRAGAASHVTHSVGAAVDGAVSRCGDPGRWSRRCGARTSHRGRVARRRSRCCSCASARAKTLSTERAPGVCRKRTSIGWRAFEPLPLMAASAALTIREDAASPQHRCRHWRQAGQLVYRAGIKTTTTRRDRMSRECHAPCARGCSCLGNRRRMSEHDAVSLPQSGSRAIMPRVLRTMVRSDRTLCCCRLQSACARAKCASSLLLDFVGGDE